MSARLAPVRRVFPRFDNVAWGRKLIMAIETPGNYALSFIEHLGLSTSFFGLSDRLRRSKGVATGEDLVLVEGTEALLGTLLGRYKLAVVTTRARPQAMAFVQRARLEQYFSVVVTRQDVIRMKPSAEPVRKAAAMLGVPVQHCIMVGDTTMDILSARHAGAYAVGVLSGFGERHELEKAGAHLILDQADELLSYLP